MSDFIGKTIGNYQLVELVAEDDQTLLFKAFQPGVDRYVALALLKPQLARNASAVQGFLQAAELAARMQHPNLLPVYDSGQAEDMVYRVSAFIERGTLRENLASFHDLNSLLGLVSQITAGLEYLYTQGYVHGKLKSTNTYLDAQRRPLLSDFGGMPLAGDVQDPYLSPELVQGGVVDQRTDVYALGVLLYELLTGETPPAGLVVNPRAKRPELPEALDRIVLKAMAQNPDQRYQSAAELRHAVQNAVQPPAPQPAPPPQPAAMPTPAVSQSVRVQQPRGTNWAAILLGLLLVVVCVGAAFLVIPPLLGDDEAEVAPTEPAVEQPTEPPVEQPTEPPVEQPTEPPVEQPTEPPAEPPPDLPENELPGGELPDICGSIGAAGGIAVFGLALAYRKRRRGF